MFRPLNKGIGTASEAVSGKGGNDALLKALQDARLDEWTALRLLHENTHPGVQGYICNRIPELGEALIERYLLQLVYLAVHKPGQLLERILLTLFKHSFRVAIKAQWLLLALCQDHPKSRPLESFRDQAYKAALEGKWEVPIRTAKLDPLSPHTSQQISPPFCSPSNSYITSHLAQAATQANAREGPLPPPQPYRPCYDPDDTVATQPPGSMVMSPPGAASGAVKPAGGDGDTAPAALQRKRSGALVCLLPAEQHAAPEPSAAAATADKTALGIATAAVVTQQQRQQLQVPKALEVADGDKPAWLESSGVAAFTPAIKTSAVATKSVPLNGVIPSGNAPANVGSEYCSIATSEPLGPGSVTASAAISAPVAAAAAVARVTLATVTAGSVGCPVRPLGAPGVPAASILDRIQALKRELGEGEGVSALLERAKQQGMAPVAAMEDDAVLSDDELSNRPMSPLSRLRFDTFGATLDFVETLCDASSSLTSYSQGERQNALRDALEHINLEIERANRREVAIWFPMGRRGDRVLRLSAREAVLLNSREKAPFMLFVEVLEGQNECGEDEDRGGNTDAFAGLSAGADLKANLETLGGIGPSASMMSLNGAVTKLEFGRRETYGIALTGIGAQHQLHYMHAAPVVPRGLSAAAAAAKSVTEVGGTHDMSHEQSSSSPDGRVVATRPLHGSAFTAAAGVNGPMGQPNGYSRNDMLVSPMPTRATAPVTQASLLEEQAAQRSAVEAAGVLGAVAATADGPTGHGTADSTDTGVGLVAPPAPAPQPAAAIVIPTRSASSNNIAAAMAAAMAASASGGTADSILASARSSEAGVVAVAVTASNGGAAGSGTQPATPRSCSSLSGLPPRPPSALTLPQQQQQPPVLPVGGISPVNAAKEVSVQEGGGLLAASNLLRRVFGDREEPGLASNSEETGGAAGILRAALDGKFSAMEAPRWGTIASAAAASAAPLASLPTTPLVAAGTIAAAAAPAGLKPSLTGQQAVGVRGPESAQHRQCPGPAPLQFPLVGAHPIGIRSVFANPMEAKLLELGPAGLFGVSSGTRAGPEVMAMLSDISASLRGEMPMVRVRIILLGPSDAAATATTATAAGGNASGCGPNGQPPNAFSLATLGSRAKAALLNQQPPLPAAAASEDAAEGSQSKTALLLSRLGWCRKPAAEDDGGDGAGAGAGVMAGGGSSSTAATAPTVSSSSSVPLGGGASHVTIPVISGGLLAAKRLAGRAGGSEHPPPVQLVRLVLTVATQGVNLDIKSPHRKSRRMPSHEAIEMMADKYKIHKLPPPFECGPPLGPYAPYSSNGALDQLYECTSDEGEGKAQSTSAPPPRMLLEAEAATDAKPYACVAGDVAGQMVESVSAAPPSITTPPSVPLASATKTVALGAPLPPEWESRCASDAEARSLPVQIVPRTPGSVGGRCDANGPETFATATATSEWWKSGPTAVAEAANSVRAAVAERVRQQLTSLSSPAPSAGNGDFTGNRGMCLPERSEAMEAGCGATTVAAPPAAPAMSASSSSLAASLQSSLTRILNRSAAAGALPQLQSQLVQQPQASSIVESSPVATVAVTGISSGTAASVVSDGAGQSKEARFTAPLHSGTSLLPALPSVERHPFSSPVAQGPGQGRLPPEAVNAAVCVDTGMKAVPPPQRTSGVSTCVEVGPVGGTPTAPASSSGLTGSLQSSIFTRILSRTTAATPIGQQQSSSTEVATAAGSGGSTVASGGAYSAGTAPRGVSPVRGGGSGGDSTNAGSGSQPQAPLVSTATGATELLAAAEGTVKGPVQQRVAGLALAEGGPGAMAQPITSGLAASLQSSLTRILNRGPQQLQPQPTALEAATTAASTSSVPGPSPRGDSPIRIASTGSNNSSTAATTASQTPGGFHDAAAAAVVTPSLNGLSISLGGSRLSKLLGRVQHEQQQQQQQPSAAPNQNMALGQQQLQLLPQQQLTRGQSRTAGMQQGRLASQQMLDVEPAVAAPSPRPLPYSLPKVTDGRYERESLEERRRREAQAVYGERWAAKVKRIQHESPHGRRQGWALRCVIVKSGDDCRQELLALQLVRLFGDIFAEAGLPLWVRYYEVLVTSNKTALIEMVPNTLSIHTIKSRSPPGTSLSDHFFAKFGRSGTSECTAAQRRFTESLAAYSLICYLLQIKDRHNGNILIDDDGRVVHIDYGFLLSNSPGGVNFESAPFKLTRELLEVMDSNSDGRPSEMFDYFKVLMIQGFIAVRNCSDRIMLLVKIMSKSGFPCFKGGDRALKALEKRLMSSLTEVQCVEHVLHLIAESLDAWRTRQYDYYQRVLNGIL
ncbi:hypothetical protein VaNZ11_004831 [Volvox africanus]|uniref:PI3K/PI4K catalytic domain-containing protein n=1 Tax=Volvox africanus TaxID=51714 RepID=A0ABQ5RX87_9CHLO|nr:hypothetical protein VaNZ11_004831 [Volvox africanus]